MREDHHRHQSRRLSREEGTAGAAARPGSAGTLSLGFGVFNEDARDLYDVFTGESVLEDIILPGVFTGVDVVPATKTLQAAEEPAGAPG